jgi:hypothetical protein
VLEITHGEDRLFIQDPVYTFYNDGDNTKPTEAIYLFSDRGLYRPGQPVYYKGIVRKGDKVSEDRDQEVAVTLYNANREVVEKTVKKVNEFGSFSGQFTLPQVSLNGTFFIMADNKNQIAFKVEEYKRPKFSITYDTLKVAYMVSDTVSLTGNTVSYAGNHMNGAKVSYRVVRNPRFIYPFLSKPGWFPSMEITHGETVTDKSGKFVVSFPAIPDLKIAKTADPVFDYTVYTEVTDRNGETRSANTTVAVSYKSLLIQSDIPAILEADSLKSLAIRTVNANGAFMPSKVSIKISRLLPEQRLIRLRYWQRPDVFAMSKETYIAHFPNDEYDHESNLYNWPVQDVVMEKTDSITANTPFSVSETRFLPGYYKIEINTNDKNNALVKDERYIELTHPSSDVTSFPNYLSFKRGTPIEPGEKTHITLDSSADSVFVIGSSSQKRASEPPFSFFTMNHKKQTFTFYAGEKDRGGYAVNYVFVKHNRVHQYNAVIAVPWTNKELKIEYATFRDKTLPGSEEKWKLKITGYKNEKIAAELLAGMYDASLDQFHQQYWTKPKFETSFVKAINWKSHPNSRTVTSHIYNHQSAAYKSFTKQYDEITSFKPFNYQPGISIRGSNSSVQYKKDAGTGGIGDDLNLLNEVVVAGSGTQQKAFLAGSIAGEPLQHPVNIRKNLNETAFFFPNLKTDKEGAIEFSFTMPEAVTRWKFQALAHTPELAFGYSSKEIVTQKDLMVQTNTPRFLREGDKISFSSQVVNLTDKPISGTVGLQLFDTETNAPADQNFKNKISEKPFSLAAKESKTVTFPLEVPLHFSKPLTWRVVAQSASVSDGEQNILPVLTNRTLVTEAMPIAMQGDGSKHFRFEKLISAGSSKTLTSHSLKAEYTSNPAWYVVQALPYLMEHSYESAEQAWNRYFANAIGTHIASTSPQIAKVFETWRTEDTTALLSNLQKNPELKPALLEETPWVMSAKTEAEQKRNIALLFDRIKMDRELNISLDKVIQMQSKTGGFPWFKDGPDDRYITQYIITGIGHLRKVKAIQKEQEEKISSLLQNALPYLDKKLSDDYDELARLKQVSNKYVPGHLIIQYLYMRSFFPELKLTPGSEKAYAFFREQIRHAWLSESKYMQGMIALTLYRSNDKNTARAILKSLEETAVYSQETGMTWTSGTGSWWYQAQTERQALLIEAFEEIGDNPKTVHALRTWLLKNKQTTGWKTTKATAEACYALLLQGTDWLSAEPVTTIHLGETILNSTEEKQTAGTGYFSKTITANEIAPSMGHIKVDLSAGSQTGMPGWGAVYWQYFEELDKITFAETPLKIVKKLFIERNSDTGPVLSPITEGTLLRIGDKVKVRIELRVDRDMEYVHMKDMRASALEPVNVLSGYKWQGGLGYYESTKDAGTHFFFNYLHKGAYVFEYLLFVTHDGDFSNGITTVQCMYAPEFTAHSEGMRIRVK